MLHIKLRSYEVLVSRNIWGRRFAIEPQPNSRDLIVLLGTWMAVLSRR